MGYMDEVLGSSSELSGGFAAPAENLDSTKVKAPREYGYEEFLEFDEADSLLLSEIIANDEEHMYGLSASGKLVPEEQDLADALVEITEKYGKFNDDNTGVWAGYTSAKDNADNAAIGVKCGNCVFWEAPNGCQLISAETEEGGLCRFAVLPDGAVTADVGGYGGECPPATQDIQLNLTNRQNAIDNVGYGPLNPAEPNEEFWQDKADRWKTDIQEAKSAVCGNCIFFVRTPKMLDCIENGIGLGAEEAEGSIEAGELGYCNALDFKCASERTCNAWAAGGPVTEDTPIEAAGTGPCWDGYVQVGMKNKNGKMVPNCVPAAEAALYATAGSKPAPKKDRIKGSSKNKKGSAATGKGVNFTEAITTSLEKKVKAHNEKAREGRKTSLTTLKAVYRRGAGAFSTSHRPDQNRNSWAMARVNAYLHLLKSGTPKNPKYTTDNDLLPKSHPRSTR